MPTRPSMTLLLTPTHDEDTQGVLGTLCLLSAEIMLQSCEPLATTRHALVACSTRCQQLCASAMGKWRWLAARILMKLSPPALHCETSTLVRPAASCKAEPLPSLPAVHRQVRTSKRAVEHLFTIRHTAACKAVPCVTC